MHIMRVPSVSRARGQARWFAQAAFRREPGCVLELLRVVTTVEPARGDGHAGTDSTRCA